MISVKEAKLLILEHTRKVPVQPMPLAMAAGSTLGMDIYAKCDMPAFKKSLVNGYAIRFEDKKLPLTIQREMKSGTCISFALKPQHTVYVQRGSVLPLGADTIVLSDRTEIRNGLMHIVDLQLSYGTNVRQEGEKITSGTLAMQKGCKLTPTEIEFLAGIGHYEVEVCRTPTVAIIVTGEELKLSGQQTEFGQVKKSNSYFLTAALRESKISKINFYNADRTIESLTSVFEEALLNNDVVLVTCGADFGCYDFILSAAGQAGITQIFHKIRKMPDKPMYFGKTDTQLVFGLPGSGSYVLNCFYDYVMPALEKINQYKDGIKRPG